MAQFSISILVQATLLLLLTLPNLPGTIPARHVVLPSPGHVQHQHVHEETMQPRERIAMKEPNGRQKSRMQENKVETFQVAGSRLPDCLYACGSCSPCRLVMARSTCSQLTDEAESCLMAYKCMCNAKTYPVP